MYENVFQGWDLNNMTEAVREETFARQSEDEQLRHSESFSEGDFGDLDDFDIEDILSQSAYAAIAPYIEAHIEKRVKEELAERTIGSINTWLTSNVTWVIGIPIVVASIIMIGKYAKKRS